MATGFTLSDQSYTLAPASVGEGGPTNAWELFDAAGKRLAILSVSGRTPDAEAEVLRQAISTVAYELPIIRAKAEVATEVTKYLGEKSADALSDLSANQLTKLAELLKAKEKSIG